jgi:hypothetical protein
MNCKAGEWNDGGMCRTLTICPAGTVVDQEGTETQDTHCADCDAGTWDDDADPSTACVPWRECSADVESQDGTTTSDRLCIGNLWQVQFGTTGADTLSGLALHPSGDVIVAGHTNAAFEGVNIGNYDGYVRRLSSFDGSEVWTVQFGSTTLDTASAGVVVDGAGDLYVAGNTSLDLAGTGALGGRDIYVFKLAGSDGSILWRRQFGSKGDEYASRLVRAGDTELVLTGWTSGDLGAKVAAEDAFVAKLSMSDGSDIWVTQFGSDGYDQADDVALDKNGDIFLGGATDGLLGAEQFGGDDCIVAKFSGDQGNLLWLTQFGTVGIDQVRGIATDAAGMVYAAGFTEGDLDGDGPEVHHGKGDAVLQALNPETGELGWLSQYGGAEEDRTVALVVREGRDIVSVGITTADAAYPYAYSALLRAGSLSDGSELWRETYSPTEAGPYISSFLEAVIVDSSGTLTLAGTSGGSLFGPTAGNDDVIVLRLAP